MSTISKNIIWSVITSLLQAYTGSVVFIVLAKLMSVEEFGILSFGFALSAILVVCADFGFSLMLIKDFPEKGLDTNKYLVNSMLDKVWISIFICLCSFIYLLAFYSDTWLIIGEIYILFAVISSFTIYLQALLKVQNRFGKYSETAVIYAACITLTTLAYWLIDLSLVALTLSLLACKIIQLVWTIFLCRNTFKMFSFDLLEQKKLLNSSWSYGLHMIVGIFYFMIDTQLISIYLGAKEVALYQSVFRIVLILMMVSEMLSNVLLPYLSYKYANRDNISKQVEKLMLYLCIIGCSLFLLFTTFEDYLTVIYSKEYLYAIRLVLPFSIVIIIRTICSLLGNVLTISNNQFYRVFSIIIVLIVSLLLNLIFIPKFGIVAAAWNSVVVHLCLLAFYSIFTKKEIDDLKLISLDVVLVLIGTVILFFGIEITSNFGHLVSMVGVILWVCYIYLIMRRNDNYYYLTYLLKEKGI